MEQKNILAGVPVTGSPEWHVRHNPIFAQWAQTVHGLFWRVELTPTQRRELATVYARGHGKSDRDKRQMPRLIKH